MFWTIIFWATVALNFAIGVVLDRYSWPPLKERWVLGIILFNVTMGFVAIYQSVNS